MCGAADACGAAEVCGAVEVDLTYVGVRGNELAVEQQFGTSAGLHCCSGRQG